MAYDLARYERGQVWMIRSKTQRSVGREQSKDRPWLILSVGKFNQSAGMITCVPITTRDKIHTPAQVLFTNHMGIKNVILCEQIRSFDYTSGEYTLDFMGNLSDKVLEAVDVSLSIHLGLHYSPVSLNNLYDSMEAVVKSIMSLQDNSKKFSDADVLKFAQKLRETTQNLVENSSIGEEVSSESIPVKLPEISTEITTTAVNTEEETSTPVEPIPKITKSPRNKWTKENCEKFLDDINRLPMKEVMTKWNIPKKTRVYSMKHYVQGLLDKN